MFVVCDQKNVTEISSISYGAESSAKKALFLADVESWPEKNYWIPPNGVAGNFIINLGCVKMFDKVQLVNTHNGSYRNRNTKQFR